MEQSGVIIRYSVREVIYVYIVLDEEQFYYKLGDFILVVVFLIYNIGIKLLQCGGLWIIVSLDVVMIIEYVVEIVNNFIMFDGMLIGFLLLDICNDLFVI